MPKHGRLAHGRQRPSNIRPRTMTITHASHYKLLDIWPPIADMYCRKDISPYRQARRLSMLTAEITYRARATRISTLSIAGIIGRAKPIILRARGWLDIDVIGRFHMSAHCNGPIEAANIIVMARRLRCRGLDAGEAKYARRRRA